MITPSTTASDQAATLRQLARDRAPRPAPVAATAPVANGPRGQTRVLTITSGKGGVGKSVVVSNMAICLARMNYRVLILDADLGLANIDVMMGVDATYDLSHALRGERRLSEIMIPVCENVSLIPAASGDEDLANLGDEGRLSLLSQFDELAPEVDFLLIDSSAGISANVIYFNLAAQAPLLVVTPEPTSITDAYAMIKVLSQEHRVRRFLTLINRARNSAEAQGVYETLLRVSDRFLDSVSLEYLGFLPDDYRVNRAIRARRPIADLYPTSPAGLAFEKLCQRVAKLPIRDGSAGNPGFLRQSQLNQV